MFSFSIFACFGVTWILIGGLMMFRCHKKENEYVKKQEKSEWML